jgi:hypothetical protein
MDPRSIDDVFTLAPTQLGMLFQILANPGSAMYLEQTLGSIRGPLDDGAFHEAWQLAVDRHDSLRTGFVWEGLSRPVQVVHRRAEVEMQQLDWRGLGAAEQAARTAGFLAADRRRGFDLTRPPLTRLALLRLADELHTLVWTSNHLVVDAWCVSILLHEVLARYQSRRAGRPRQLPPAPRYRDYVRWLKGRDLAADEAFWRRALAGFTAPTPLPGCAPAAAQAGAAGCPAAPAALEPLRLAVEPSAVLALTALLRRRRLTLHAAVAGAWALVLGQWSGQPEVVFGTVVSGRPAELPGIDRMVGLFINTLPLRVRIRPAQPAVDWLREVQAAQGGSQQFEHTPLGRIQSWSEVPAGQPLVETLLVLLNAVDLSAAATGLRISYRGNVARSSFPLVVRVYPEPELLIEMLFDPQRLRREAVAARLRSLAGVLAELAAHPDRPVAELAARLRQQDAAEHGRQARERRATAGLRLRRGDAGSLASAHRDGAEPAESRPAPAQLPAGPGR